MALDVQELGGHSHECGHCRPFWRALRNGLIEATGPVIDRAVDCPQCGRDLIVVNVDGIDRCVECGIPDLMSEGHLTQLWWSEDPSSQALSIGWGGSEIWACACGERDEGLTPAGQRWAEDHAMANGGRLLATAIDRPA